MHVCYALMSNFTKSLIHQIMLFSGKKHYYEFPFTETNFQGFFICLVKLYESHFSKKECLFSVYFLICGADTSLKLILSRCLTFREICFTRLLFKVKHQVYNNFEKQCGGSDGRKNALMNCYRSCNFLKIS